MRIFLADPSQQIRGKLAELLKQIPDIHIAGEVSTWDEMLGLLPELSFDFCIIDQEILKVPVTQSIGLLKGDLPTTHVIILSHVITPEYVQAFKRAGADDVVDKSLGFSHLVGILAGFVEQ